MIANMISLKSLRVFKVWEYQVSHGQLLIRSPKAPAKGSLPEALTNLDLVCLGVEYMALPSLLRGIEIFTATSAEVTQLSSLLGKTVVTNSVLVIQSEGKRFPIVALEFAWSENEWDIFESPFEYRSHFRG